MYSSDTLCSFAILQFHFVLFCRIAISSFLDRWDSDLPIPAVTARIADLDIWVLSLVRLQMLGPDLAILHFMPAQV